MLQQLVEKATPFRIDALLGHGSQGFVCRATDANGRVVALKIIRGGAVADSRSRRRFLTEVGNHAGLRHPNIVRVLESGQSDGVAWFTMDYIDGVPLSQDLPGLMNLTMFKSICGALAYAHAQGVIHRDIKPSNILVDGSGAPLVVDFGLSRRLDSTDTLTSLGHGVGTVAHADPECILGRPATKRSDVYGLGMLLYEWATGGCYAYGMDRSDPRLRRFIPYNRIVPPRDRNPDISPALATILQKCLHPSPGKRYSSVEALLSDVEAYEAGRPIRATSHGLRFSSRLWMRKNKRKVAAMTALSVPFLAIISVTFGNQFEARSQREDERTQSQILADFRADIGSQRDAYTSAQIAAMAADNHPIESRLALPVIHSTELPEFETIDAATIEYVRTHRIVMEVDRSEDWLHRELPLGLGVVRNTALRIIESDFANQNDASLLKSLEAARLISCDIATGPLAIHTSMALDIRMKIFELLIAKSSQVSTKTSFKAWLEKCPPLPSYDIALVLEEMKIAQVIEHSISSDGTLDLERLGEVFAPVFEDVPNNVSFTQVRLTELYRDVFENYREWFSLPSAEALEKHRQKMKEWSNRKEWSVLRKLIPKLHSTIKIRAKIRSLQENARSQF